MSGFPPSRRSFLTTGAAGVLIAQNAVSQTGPTPALPAPKTAKVTSSVMVWTLKGSFEEKLALVAKVGAQSVELVNEHLAWSDADVAKYRKTAESYGLTIDTILAQHDWTKRPVTMVNPAHRDGFLNDVKDSIEWAKKLGVSQIIVMSGNVQADMSREAQHASMVESGKRAADLAEAARVKLILEPLNSKVNHKGYFLTSNTEGLAVVKEVDNPNFRLLFDIYHEQVQNGNVIRTLVEAEPYVTTFHVADNPGRNDPGTGEMNYDNIYKAIAKTGYSGYIAMEYLPLGDEAASLKKALIDMRKSLAAV
jgi:hydroxypyruvate isomerase